MTQPDADIDLALHRVFEMARAHLAAVRAKRDRDDEVVWRAYVALNNAVADYDGLLLDVYGEVTPWEVDPIDPLADSDRLTVDGDVRAPAGGDPYPQVLSVRQRRDYRVPSVSALLRTAQAARDAGAGAEPAAAQPVTSVGEAVLELLNAGDGSLAALDIPQLRPSDGVVVVAEVPEGLNLDEFADDDGVTPFASGPRDRVLGRLDERPYSWPAEEADGGLLID